MNFLDLGFLQECWSWEVLLNYNCAVLWNSSFTPNVAVLHGISHLCFSLLFLLEKVIWPGCEYPQLWASSLKRKVQPKIIVLLIFIHSHVEHKSSHTLKMIGNCNDVNVNNDLNFSLFSHKALEDLTNSAHIVWITFDVYFLVYICLFCTFWRTKF